MGWLLSSFLVPLAGWPSAPGGVGGGGDTSMASAPRFSDGSHLILPSCGSSVGSLGVLGHPAGTWHPGEGQLCFHLLCLGLREGPVMAGSVCEGHVMSVRPLCCSPGCPGT